MEDNKKLRFRSSSKRKLSSTTGENDHVQDTEYDDREEQHKQRNGDPGDDTTTASTSTTSDHKRLSESSISTTKSAMQNDVIAASSNEGKGLDVRQTTSNKSVCFDSDVKVHEVESYVCMPEDIVAAIWLQESDFQRIVQDNNRVLQLMINAKEKLYRKWKNNDNNNTNDPICTRGLESQTPEKWNCRENIKRSSWDMVLDEQDDQWRVRWEKYEAKMEKKERMKHGYGNDDHSENSSVSSKSSFTSKDEDRDREALATAYREISEITQEIAHMKGLMDQTEAFRIHDLDRRHMEKLNEEREKEAAKKLALKKESSSTSLTSRTSLSKNNKRASPNMKKQGSLTSLTSRGSINKTNQRPPRLAMRKQLSSPSLISGNLINNNNGKASPTMRKQLSLRSLTPRGSFIKTNNIKASPTMKKQASLTSLASRGSKSPTMKKQASLTSLASRGSITKTNNNNNNNNNNKASPAIKKQSSLTSLVSRGSKGSKAIVLDNFDDLIENDDHGQISVERQDSNESNSRLERKNSEDSEDPLGYGPISPAPRRRRRDISNDDDDDDGLNAMRKSQREMRRMLREERKESPEEEIEPDEQQDEEQQKQKKERRRQHDPRVSFVTKVEFINNPSNEKFRTLPREVWYTEKEIDQMKSVRRKVKKKLQKKKKKSKNGDDELNGNDENDELNDLRGFEHTVLAENRKVNLRTAWEAVLNEQSRQYAKLKGEDNGEQRVSRFSTIGDIVDEEALADAYKSSTKHCIKNAIKRAQLDQQVAIEILENDRELEKKRRLKQNHKRSLSAQGRRGRGESFKGHVDENTQQKPANGGTFVASAASGKKPTKPTKPNRRRLKRNSDIAPKSPMRQPTLKNVFKNPSKAPPPPPSPWSSRKQRESPITRKGPAQLKGAKRNSARDIHQQLPVPEQVEVAASPTKERKLSLFGGLLGSPKKSSPSTTKKKKALKKKAKEINYDDYEYKDEQDVEEEAKKSKARPKKKNSFTERFRVPNLQ